MSSTGAWEGLAPLVGRDGELEAVDRMLAGMRRRRPAIVHVIGEPGIGKTRLLGEICQRADGHDFLVLRGVAEGPRSGRLFAALAEPFTTYVDELGPSRAPGGTHEDPDLARLASLAGPDDASDDVSARVVSDAVRRLLAGLARERPVVLAYDDVQWCDEGTLDVLVSLTRHPPRGGVVVVMSYRPLPGLHALLDVPSGRIEGPVVGTLHRFELAALSEGQLAALLPDSSPARRRALFAACGGNPFYLQAVDAAAEVIVPGTQDDGRLPDAVRHALAAELDALEPTTRRVADAAAVIGGVLEPELVAHVAEMPRDDVLDAFDVLCARTVCKSVGPGRWQFRHPLLARVAYDVQSTAARYRAHHAAAEALARSGAPLAAQARHVAVSSPRGDRAAAHTLAAAAGELAAQAPGQAAQWYAAAMDIAPADDGEWLRDVDLARARALVAVGSLDEAHDILHEFLASAPAIDPQRMTATVLAARVAYLLGRHDEAGAILQRELSSNVEWAAADLAAGLVELATARLMGADFGGARDAAQRALDLAPAAERLTVAGAAAALTLGCVASGDVAVGLSHREQAAELVDGLADGELGASLEVGVWLGWAEMFLESVEPARRHLERCLRIARRGAHQHLLTHLLVGWGSVLKIAGDLPGATEAYDEAREAGERVGSAEMTTMATAMQCRAATWRGDLAAAERYGSQAVAMAAERSNWFASVAAALLAQARLVAGEPAGCVDAILRAGGGADLPGFDPSSRCDWWEVAITAAVAEDDLATARDLSGRSRRQADQLPLRTPTGFAMLGDARIALADGDAETGAELAARAADLFGSIGHRLEAARSRQLEALARARGGQRALAIDLLTEVEAVYAQCRAARLRAEARGELRRLGRRVGSVAAPGGGRRSEAAPASVSALSAREREVAVLVAAGRTNRQIAADLVVSEKTVESHLAHIFVKLEVTSRAAVAAAIAAANSP